MASGTWVTQDKDRPGIYTNVESEPRTLGTLGERGTTAFAATLDWGAVAKVTRINAGDNTFKVLGNSLDHAPLAPVREALKRAKTVLVYRINGGETAKATSDTLTITAKYPGTRGNDITIVIESIVGTPATFEITTMVGGRAEDVQLVKTFSELNPNDWVIFTGDGAGVPVANAGIVLTGGTNKDAVLQDFADFLDAIERESFDTIAMPFEEANDIFVAFIKRLRDTEGRKIVGVMKNYPLADYEGIISVKNGVILANNVNIDATLATFWVAGASAAAQANYSLTYQPYDGAVDAFPRLTNDETITALREGQIVFTFDNDRAIVEQDINTLKSFTVEKGKEFRKNRVVRVLDGINNDMVRIFGRFYIGKIDNNLEGRGLLKGEAINLIETYQQINAITNFDSQRDIEISLGDELDSVYIIMYIQPVDSIEKIYVQVVVRTIDPQ